MRFEIVWKDPVLGHEGVTTFPQTREAADTYAARLIKHGYEAEVVEYQEAA